MRAAFIPALPPSALLAGMIAPSFRLVNRFCGKKLLRTCGRCARPHALCAVFSWSPLAYVLLRTCGRRERPPALCAVWARSPLAYVLLPTCGRHERPPALCAVWAWSPLAYVKGSLPFDRSLWHGPSLRRTQAARALRAPERRKKRVSPHPAAVPAGPCSLAPPVRSPVACARSRCGRRVPAPTARAMGAGLPRPRSAQAFRVSKGHKKRVSPHPVAAYAGPCSSAPSGKGPRRVRPLPPR